MPDNFLHAQYADLLRRLGFAYDEANLRWINPKALHIVVHNREDEYSVYGYGALPRTFNLRESAKCETVVNSLLIVNSSRDSFDQLYAWATAACEDINTRFPHTEFFVRTNFKAEPVIWFGFKDVDAVPMQVANCDNLKEDIRNSSLNKPKSDIVLEYMARNGFYESLDNMPAVEHSETSVTYYVKRARLQNCALVSLADVVKVETICFATKTKIVDADENLSDSTILALINERENHEYIALTCKH